jgi:molybdate transport system permease protein
VSFEPLALSFEVAFLATLIAGVAGIAIAALLARTRFIGSGLIDALITAPMVIPPTVFGYLLLVVLGRMSPLGRAYEALTGGPLVFTRVALVLAASIAALPFIVRSSRAALEDVDPHLIGAARTLGAGPLRVLLTVELPLSLSGIASGLTLGFARALGEFGITFMVAGNFPGLTRTGALAIYDAVQADRDDEAIALSLVMSALAVALLWAVNRLTRSRRHGF